MGTLTADYPRLAEHCPHKLATSCRLTSTPNCCACADNRQHNRTYRVYIDGVGFVQRGTRWQGYCWFCKEFWNNRLAATDPPLEISHTRIPEIPDQTEFLERWNEFHQGYRIAKRSDGTEQRIAVIGEPFKEVSPGFLPRTLAQLRAGVVNDARRAENRLSRRRLSTEEEPTQEPPQSLEETFDALIAEISDEEAPSSNSHAEPTPIPQIAELPGSEPAPHTQPQLQPRPLTRGQAQLQRARERFARVFGSREDVQQDDYISPLATMYGRAYDRYRQAEQRRAEGTSEAPASLDGLSAQERRDIEEQLLWGVMRESQTMSSSLESEGDVWSYAPAPQSQDDEVERNRVHQSILTAHQQRMSMSQFRQHAQHILQQQEEQLLQFSQQQQQRMQQLREMSQSQQQQRIQQFMQLEQQQQHQHEQHEAPRPSNPAEGSDSANTPRSTTSTGLTGVRTSLQQINSELRRLRLASEALSSMHARSATRGPVVTLDNQPDRPEPKTDEEMTKTLACQVCYQQLADIAVLPCGHMVMCQWCADVVIPIRHSYIPVQPSKCPMCRKQVKQRFKIHMGS